MSSGGDPEPYEPIACGLHDRFEAAAVRRDRIRLGWTTAAGAPRTMEGTIRDIVVRDGAEYLVLSDDSEVRLDRIRSFETTR